MTERERLHPLTSWSADMLVLFLEVFFPSFFGLVKNMDLFHKGPFLVKVKSMCNSLILLEEDSLSSLDSAGVESRLLR